MALSLPWLYIYFNNGRLLQLDATTGVIVSESVLVPPQKETYISLAFTVPGLGVNLVFSPGMYVSYTLSYTASACFERSTWTRVLLFMQFTMFCMTCVC